MKTKHGLSLLGGLALSLSLCGPLSAQIPEVGTKPPEINAREWLNTIGPGPDLASLQGQAVLLEFWATW